VSYEKFAIICIFLLLWLLATKAWFWCAFAAALGIAALISMATRIFHFQLLSAFGFLFLGAIFWLVSELIYESKIKK
jgi:predicted membrane channel-forming protein YqfA (hemolysin III family)